jgi:endonuclease YncB( thermonuclease family)
MAKKKRGRVKSPIFFPTYVVIPGTFLTVGYEPDGDSIRFAADDPAQYNHLHRSHLIQLSKKDGSVQLRFEGIDATELHYGGGEQPLGREARDALLKAMGFTSWTLAAGSPSKIATSDPASLRGGILSTAADVHGRPISYAMLKENLPSSSSIVVDEATLRATLNFEMLNSGLAYLLTYTSMPLSHRDIFHNAAQATRDADRGVWAIDSTAEFVLKDESSIDRNGACIFPKLFRRCTDYIKAVKAGFRGELKEWILSTSTSPARDENDGVVIWNAANPQGSVKTHLSELIDQRNNRVSLQGDLLSLVFIEK